MGRELLSIGGLPDFIDPDCLQPADRLLYALTIASTLIVGFREVERAKREKAADYTLNLSKDIIGVKESHTTDKNQESFIEFKKNQDTYKKIWLKLGEEPKHRKEPVENFLEEAVLFRDRFLLLLCFRYKREIFKAASRGKNNRFSRFLKNLSTEELFAIAKKLNKMTKKLGGLDEVSRSESWSTVNYSTIQESWIHLFAIGCMGNFFYKASQLPKSLNKGKPQDVLEIRAGVHDFFDELSEKIKIYGTKKLSKRMTPRTKEKTDKYSSFMGIPVDLGDESSKEIKIYNNRFDKIERVLSRNIMISPILTVIFKIDAGLWPDETPFLIRKRFIRMTNLVELIYSNFTEICQSSENIRGKFNCKIGSEYKFREFNFHYFMITLPQIGQTTLPNPAPIRDA